MLSASIAEMNLSQAIIARQFIAVINADQLQYDELRNLAL
jgi:hypothetical protein